MGFMIKITLSEKHLFGAITEQTVNTEVRKKGPVNPVTIIGRYFPSRSPVVQSGQGLMGHITR